MRRFLLSAFSIMLLTLVSIEVQAQDEEITDEQLRRYALLEEVIDIMKKEISVSLNEMIRAQDGMDGKRYKELSATKGDAAKLEEIGAKEYEVKFLELVNNMVDERKQAIITVNSELAKKMIGDGGKVYQSIKDGLSSDENLKVRYEAIKATIAGQDS